MLEDTLSRRLVDIITVSFTNRLLQAGLELCSGAQCCAVNIPCINRIAYEFITHQEQVI